MRRSRHDPVWLERIDGHAGWANTAAMRRVERDLAGDWQPEGGRIIRAGGRPTGVFVDAATSLVDAVVPPPDAAFRTEALQRALQATASVGLTGVHDMGTSRRRPRSLQAFRRRKQAHDARRRLRRRRRGGTGSNCAVPGPTGTRLGTRPDGRREVLCRRRIGLAGRRTARALQRRSRQSRHARHAAGEADRWHEEGACAAACRWRPTRSATAATAWCSRTTR